jgi:3-methylcrotonyl-CoA carboxylase alpha subunit
VAAAVALTLEEEKARETADPFSSTDGWRLHGSSQRRFEFEFHGESQAAQLWRAHDGTLQLALGDVRLPLRYSSTAKGLHLELDAQRRLLQVYRRGEVVHVFGAMGATQITEIDLLAHAGEAQSEAGRLTAPMPGKVVSFHIKVGDTVSRGQTLAVMEAMKMEHTIAAPDDGVVTEILYAPGDQVLEGAELLTMAA